MTKNEIPWPQYYQGDGLGITEILTVFVIDQPGKLYSADALENLETIIHELLSRRDETRSP